MFHLVLIKTKHNPPDGFVTLYINFINLEVQGHQVIQNCASVEEIGKQNFSSKFCCSSGGDNPHLYVQVSIEGYVLVSFAACELPDFLEVEVNIAGLVRTVVASDSKKEWVQSAGS